MGLSDFVEQILPFFSAWFSKSLRSSFIAIKFQICEFLQQMLDLFSAAVIPCGHAVFTTQRFEE